MDPAPGGDPDAAVSAHYAVDLDGSVHQYVDLDASAWANGVLEPGNRWERLFGIYYGLSPNLLTVSIETIDNGDPSTPVTDEQYGSVLNLCLIVKDHFSPTIGFLLKHSDISPRTRPSCPGPRWVESGRFTQLGEDAGLEATG